MKIDLNGKIALITGASRGIGAAIFAALGNAGAAVIGTATGETGANAINNNISKNQLNGMAITYDASDIDQSQMLIDKIRSHYNSAPDIVVCNAGITADGLLMRMKDDQWRQVMDTNLSGVFYLSRAAIPSMLKKRAGRIIIISSVVATIGNAGQTNYCATKAGVEGFMRAVAREVGGRGVTVNAIAPGFINTDMTAKLDSTIREQLAANTPLARIGEPEDIAAAAVFLASDGASFITGHTLHVNGGLAM